MFGMIKPVLLGVAVALLGAGCNGNQPQQAGTNSVIRAADVGAETKEAVAVVHGTQGNEKVMGVVKFMDTGNGVKVTADIDGLAPDSEHGFHIHQFGEGAWPLGHTLTYVNNHSISPVMAGLYILCTCLPPLLSGSRILNLFGVIVIAGLAITFLAFYESFISVWCFFAALASLILWKFFHDRRLSPAALAEFRPE